MPTVPESNVGKIQWYEDHLQRFTTNAVAIGTTAADVTDLTDLTKSARNAYADQQLALSEARDKTLAVENAVRAMAVKGGGIIKQVRVKAEMTGNPNVYVLAGVPAPATPSARGRPGTPFDFKCVLLQNGWIDVSFKCASTGGGAMYQVYRRAAGQPSFAHVCGTGQKSFVDATIPAGCTSVTYQVQAVRSTAVGDFAEFNVNFGTSAAGAATATLGETTVTLAA